MSVEQALGDFVSHYLKTYPRLEEAYDRQWRSACEIGEPITGEDGIERILWQPVKRHPDTISEDFRGLEDALEVAIHPDIKAYYGAYFCGGLEADAPAGHVSLILLWNNEDLVRLIENLIGHALAKQRAKSPFSVFCLYGARVGPLSECGQHLGGGDARTPGGQAAAPGSRQSG